MSHAKVDQELLIKKTILLFSKQGYYNTTMEDIAHACNIEKSSLYHHIASRKELLTLSLRYIHDLFKKKCLEAAYHDEFSAQHRLTAIAQTFENHFNELGYYCICANLANENLQNMPEATVVIQAYFNDCSAAIIYILKDHCEARQAKEFAEDILAQIQGALLFSRIQNNPDIFKRALSQLISLPNKIKTCISAAN